ncbi:hypothetical protein ACLM7F_24875, partial [Salmonella enterica subsp. enterica]|uniref:hypothetical protein n=1 Tax=Salmonella enterica TaxID=28901 RepID=UPI003D336923
MESLFLLNGTGSWSPIVGKTSMIQAIVDEYSHSECDLLRVENSLSADVNTRSWIDLEMTGLD